MSKNWNNITKEELTELAREYTNSMIGEMYGITVGQVQYKRKKLGITMYDLAFQDALEEKNKQKRNRSVPAKDWLFDKDNIDPLSKAITQYAFRSGPIEQIQIDKKLTSEDMKSLNKYMVNRIAGLLQKAFDGEWDQISKVFNFYVELSGSWDEAVPDTREFDAEF